jgi:hypothetical protein
MVVPKIDISRRKDPTVRETTKKSAEVPFEKRFETIPSPMRRRRYPAMMYKLVIGKFERPEARNQNPEGD